MAESNAQRKKRRVIPNTDLEQEAQPALPPSVAQGAGFFRPRSTSVLSEFGRGVESGVETVEGLGQGFTGAVAGSLGFEDEGRKRLALEEERLQAAQINAPRIERVQDVTNLKDAADFVAGIAGKQGIIFGTVAAGGAAAAAASPILPVTAPFAAAAGAVGTGIGLETGDAFSSIAGDPESVENLGFQGASLTSLGAGAVAGSLEAVPALAAVKRIGLLKPFQRAVRGKLAERVTKGALSQAGVEGLTEGAQTIVQRTAANFANENREILGEEGYDELINSIATGAIFGLGVGGVTGAVGGRGPQAGSIEDQVDLEETLDALDFSGGSSREIEEEIDRLGEPGQDIRDARLRPSLRRIGETPADVVAELLQATQTEGGLDRIPQSRLFAAIRELVDPEEQLTDMLIVQGVEDAAGTAAALVERAGLEQQEFLEDLAAAPAEGKIVEQRTDDAPSEGAELGTSEDDLGAKQFSVDENFRDMHSTRNFIFRNANGTLGFVPSQKEGQENSLTRAVAGLERNFPDIVFDQVGLGDALVEELDKQIKGNPEEVTSILNDVAAQKLIEPGFNADRHGQPDPADPRTFLNQFQAIRRTLVDTKISGADQFRLTDGDVFGGPLSGTITPAKQGTRGKPGASRAAVRKATVSVRQPKSKPLVAERQITKDSDVLVTVPIKKKTPGKGTGTETVQVDHALDAVKLTNLMLTKLRHKGPRTVDIVANAFFNGLSGLAERGIVIDTEAFPASLVVSKKNGKNITYGEITTIGAGRIRARIANFKSESVRIQEDIQEQIKKINAALTPDKQRRAKFILKKFKRRVKKIPDDISVMAIFGKSTQRDADTLNANLANARELLDAEELDLDSFVELANDVDDLVFNLRKEGTPSLQIESLSNSSKEMQELADAAFQDRKDVRFKTSPEGSLDAFGRVEGAEAFEVKRLREQERIEKQTAFDALRHHAKLKKKMKFSENVAGPLYIGDKPRTKKMDAKLQKDFKKMVTKLKLATTLKTTREEVEDHLTKVRGDREAMEAWVKFKNGESGGVYDAVNDVALLNPFFADPKTLNETMAHEIGHAVFKKYIVSNQSPQAAAIRAEFEKWREANSLPDADSLIVLATKSPFNTAMDRLIFGEMKSLEELSPKIRKYVLDYEEWFADQVSRFFTSPKTVKQQLSIAEKTFKDIADDLIELFKELIELTKGYKPAASVADLLDQIIHDEAEVQVLSEEFQSLLETADLPADTPAVAGVMQALDPFGKSTPWMLRKAFVQVLSEDERNTLFKFFSRASQKRRLKELTGTDAQKLLIDNNPLHAAVFGYQMWIAGKFTIKGQGTKILEQEGISQEEVAGPVSQFVLNLFTTIFDKLSSLFGIIHADQQAEQILDAIREGYIDQRKTGQKRWAVNKQLKDTMLQRIGGTFNSAFQHLKPFYDKALVVADQRMLDTGIPGLMKIARAYHAPVGQEGQAETFFEARQTKIGLFMTSYTQITKDLRDNSELKADVLAAMRNPKKAAKDPEVQRIAQEIFQFNRRFRNYMVAAKLNVGDRGPRYFPWVYDPRKVQDNMDFIDGLLRDSRFSTEMDQWLSRRNEEIAARNTDKINQGGEAKQNLEPLLSMDELIEEIEMSLVQNEGYADTELNPSMTGTTPWFASMHQRALGFLIREEDGLSANERERFDGLFSDQMDLVMMTYIRQGVKRAEYARRFGSRSETLEQFIQEASAEGASKAQLDTAYQYIDAMNGVIGESTNQRVSKLLRLGKREGEVINPHYRTFTSLMMVIQNMAVLPLATLTSLADPVGIMVRSQDTKATMAALRVGAQEIAFEIKNLVGNDETTEKNELRHLAEGMGVIEDHMTNEALEWEYGSTYLTPRLKATNEFFFKAIGLTQWTRVTRIMALAGGKEFIKRHIQRPNQNSDRFLRQLNLAPEDVKFDKNGDLLVLTRMQRETDGKISPEELARDSRVRNALNRFVNESILRPNAAQRPIWASDPNYALVFHLKSFMFSFHDRILRRVAQEAALGNTVPLILLSAFIPAMLFADMLRDMIRFGLGGNPRKAHWGLEDHLWSATQRSGVNGIGQLLIDAKQDVQFGGFGYESLVGPTVDGIGDLDGLFADDSSEQWSAFGRNLPGNAVWKHWLENGFDEQ